MQPEDLKRQVTLVGNDLSQKHGKKYFYSIEEVEAANLRQKVEPRYFCWSHAAFNCHADFIAHHKSIGEVSDYASMRVALQASANEPAAEKLFFNSKPSWFELLCAVVGVLVSIILSLMYM